MNVNRRNNIRYLVTGNDVVARGTFSNNEAAVKDISIGGIQMQYLSEKDASDQWTQIDIISGECDPILMADVPCKVVYDIKDLMENGTFSGMDVRLCGLCFGELMQDQKEALQRLLDCHSAST